MFIVYLDNLGVAVVELDYSSVSFLNGEAVFSSNGEEYRIPTNTIIEITTNKADL